MDRRIVFRPAFRNENETHETCQTFEWLEEDVGPRLPLATGKTLNFVAESGLARPQGASRSLIRSQARKKAERRPLTPVVRQIQSQVCKDPGNDSTKNWKEPGPNPSQSNRPLSHPAPSVIAGPDNSAFDPFPSYPVAKKGHTDFYLQYYRFCYSDSYPVIFSKAAPIQLLLEFPGVLHGITFHTSYDLALQRGTKCSPDMIFHHGEAVRYVRNEIVERGNKPASMAVLIAVGLLVPFQIHTKAGFGTKEHMDGLEALVNSRGGLDAISEEGNLGMAVAWFVSWTDNIAAIFFNTPPRFMLIPSVTRCEPWATDKPPHILVQRYEAKLINLTGSKSQSRQLIELYRGLQDVLPLPKAVADKMAARGQLPQVVFYKNQLECLERRALEFSQLNLDIEPKIVIFPLFGCAALIHVLLFMREAKAAPKLSNILSARMKEIMSMVEIERLQMQYPEMTLWMLAMGGLGSRGSEHHQWFISLMAEVCGRSGLSGVDNVGLSLGDFLWLPAYHGPKMKAFWDDVALAQNKKYAL